ncbi:prepilin-type N-terminal cleavage/methylation domain-containing protein [Thalassotalea sp. M1531]|uniref:Prepilin-type N-terminal cleavage/methylation domain-containing protein n=1 Tax=Thalassotalea algicola TaxID=2716224 RepID=A0A7Y0LEW5_9GAMM|nr:prepilin-type N-terminal cleavage/methylation domain-containing protein [Thalassotalea algicola]NMP32947.1 prepilin-type N-terminal cleavage/methylation domain-containing protein [Thalassotalea algicola]
MNHKNNGFTLIELLISISILSLILLLGSYSYSLLAERWQSALTKFDLVEKDTRAFSLFNAVLSGIYPSVIYEKSNGSIRPSFFFSGSEDRLLSVTRGGLLNDFYPEVFRLVATKNSNGKIDVIYQLSALKQPITSIEQEVTFSNNIELFSDLDVFELRYLGWDSIQEKDAGLEQGLGPTLRPMFSGIENQMLPDKVFANISKNGKKMTFYVSLDNNASRFLEVYSKE